MSREKGQELFRALNTLLDAVTALNLKDLQAEAAADRGKRRLKVQPPHQREKIRSPILTGKTFHSSQFPSLLCLVGLDFLRSLESR